MARARGKSRPSSQVDQIFAQWGAGGPGAAVAVVKNGKIVHKRGYGTADLDHAVPITPSTVFHAASLAKQFTATAIMLLVRQGKLSLDEDIGDPHIHDKLPWIPNLGAITVRQLLHHTSGLRDQWRLLGMAGWRVYEDVVKDVDVQYLISRMTRLNFSPGDQYVYCNTGYSVLARIVGELSGKTLPAFVSQRILQPLQMTRTAFRDNHAAVTKDQAYGYTRTGPTASWTLSVPNFDTVGPSSLITTVLDLALWADNFFRPQVGDAALFHTMESPGHLNNGHPIPYGMGLKLDTYRTEPIIEHDGVDAGYRAHLIRFPGQDLAIALLSNRADADTFRLVRQIADIYLGQLPPIPALPAPFPLPASDIAKRVGAYWSPGTEDLAQVMGTNAASVRLASSNYAGRLHPTSQTRCLLVPPGAIGASTNVSTVDFALDASGDVLHMTITPQQGEPSTFDPKPPWVPTAAELAGYVGAYYSAEVDWTFVVRVVNGALTLERKKVAPLVPTAAFRDVFAGVHPLRVITFTRNGLGHVDGMTISSDRIRGFHFDKVPP